MLFTKENVFSAIVCSSEVVFDPKPSICGVWVKPTLFIILQREQLSKK